MYSALKTKMSRMMFMHYDVVFKKDLLVTTASIHLIFLLFIIKGHEYEVF